MIVNDKIKKLADKYHENKFSHAFLLVTNNLSKCSNDIKELIKIISCPNNFEENCQKCNLCYQIDKNLISNIVQINPDGTNIKKNQIQELKHFFMSKPILIKNNIYIINSAEKLNPSAANTMLKFIEEPEDNIIGFLITTNKENVLDTIKSRCQIINVNYSNINNLELLNISENEYLTIENLVIKYLDGLITKYEDGFFLNRIIFTSDNKNRKQIIDFFTYLFYLFDDLINGKEILKFEFLKKIPYNNFKKIQRIIFNILESLFFNTNLDLVLDKFVIEMEELI